MMLKGKKRNTYNLLTPIEEGVDYEEYLADVKAFHSSIFPAIALIGTLMYFNDSIFHMDKGSTGLANVYLLGADSIANENYRPFLITKRGNDYYLRFREAFEKDYMDGELQELRYDTLTSEFVGTDDPKFRITGYFPGWFVAEKMQAAHQFLINNSSTKSDDVTAVYESMRTALSSKKKYTLSRVVLSLGDGEPLTLKADITYTFRKGTVNQTGHLVTEYSFTYDERTVTLANMVPAENTQNLMNDIPEVADFFSMLVGKFNVEGAVSPYNLRNMRLTKADTPAQWLVINY